VAVSRQGSRFNNARNPLTFQVSSRIKVTAIDGSDSGGGEKRAFNNNNNK
jgi:hypothetical protein